MSLIFPCPISKFPSYYVFFPLLREKYIILLCIFPAFAGKIHNKREKYLKYISIMSYHIISYLNAIKSIFIKSKHTYETYKHTKLSVLRSIFLQTFSSRPNTAGQSRRHRRFSGWKSQHSSACPCPQNRHEFLPHLLHCD